MDDEGRQAGGWMLRVEWSGVAGVSCCFDVVATVIISLMGTSIRTSPFTSLTAQNT